MKYTLLKMTQLILSGMDSDEVSSISDTTESLQVVDVIEQCYNDICATVEFPDQWDLFELEPSLDDTRPTIMYIPEGVVNVEWIQYDNATDDDTIRDWKYVWPIERRTFFDRMNGLDSADTTVYNYDYLVGVETFDVRGYNNLNPTHYTTVNNRTLIFDNFVLDVGQTLQADRTKCYGMKIPLFVRDDDFIPDFEPRQFTLLFNEAKAQAFIDLKQVQNSKAEQRARRGWVHSQRKKNNTPVSGIVDDFRPNFGRSGQGRNTSILKIK